MQAVPGREARRLHWLLRMRLPRMNDLAARCAGLLDAPTLALFLTVHGTPIAAGTIRQWASNGLITRHGKDHRGRTLYDVGEVGRRALKRPAA